MAAIVGVTKMESGSAGVGGNRLLVPVNGRGATCVTGDGDKWACQHHHQHEPNQFHTAQFIRNEVLAQLRG